MRTRTLFAMVACLLALASCSSKPAESAAAPPAAPAPSAAAKEPKPRTTPPPPQQAAAPQTTAPQTTENQTTTPPAGAPAQAAAPQKTPPQPPAPQKAPPQTAAPKPAAQESTMYVLMTTSQGDILLELDAKSAPVSVDNFLGYVDAGFYEGTIFHRVISNFMIQGGGLKPDLSQKPTRPPIRNESGNGLSNKRGTIAMARTNVPDSATCQFFINVVDNPALDAPPAGGPGYAVFGKVVAGMDVVDAIRAVPTGLKKSHKDVPIKDVVIQSATRLSPADATKRIKS